MRVRRKSRSIFDIIREHVKDLEAFTNELIESTTIERPSWDLQACCLEPLCSIFVSADEVVVTADLPNIDPRNIKIGVVRKNLIEITARMRRKLHFSDFGITHRQGEFSAFRCQIHIPVPVNTKHIRTRLKQGILEVHLRRKKAQRIEIK